MFLNHTILSSPKHKVPPLLFRNIVLILLIFNYILNPKKTQLGSARNIPVPFHIVGEYVAYHTGYVVVGNGWIQLSFVYLWVGLVWFAMGREYGSWSICIVSCLPLLCVASFPVCVLSFLDFEGHEHL